MLSEIASQLGIDSSFYTQFILITVFYFVVSGVFLKPYQKLFELRESKTAGASKEALELSLKADQMTEEYKARLKGVNERVRGLLKKGEEEAKKEAAHILEKATTEARAKTQAAQVELSTQKDALLQSLNSEAVEIAQQIVSKILGRAV